ncbi:hypothetical protein GA0116948_11524 [Chitinophaga costaii]|uniref:Uncharacterized protein n=1 Tax=Chitinophaga costaii TaxID=1335309 RepID=A0A1C4FK72_9BACT|nr:hypothetical protein [Chitinophaga costaii]PUZ29993.1 hypothetical protein DCM91_00485 [Chitinophaga costaii]SCC56398.1 hypothetical protein GA0116948_11524 [Chitinophaga costaii]
MRRSAFIFLLFLSLAGYGQQTINNFKYVLLPEKFGFAHEEDQYGLNSLAKTLLEQKGFTVYFDNALVPKELAGNRCNVLTADVTQRKSMFVTNLTLFLKDCRGNILFKSKEGKSREKEFMPAYNLALRDAFTSLDAVPYAYDSTANVATTATAVATPAAAAPAVPVATPAATPVVAQTRDASGTLYAQATPTGYQLIDTAPKIVLTLFRTSLPDDYIANNGVANGIVLKKNGNWYFEYYKDGQLISEQLLIKF